MKIKSFFLALIIVSLIVSCKKSNENDNDNNPTITKNSHRISQWINKGSSGIPNMKVTYTYDNEKLVKNSVFNRVIGGGDELVERSKMEYIYSDNSITRLSYPDINISEPEWKTIFTLNGNLITDAIIYTYDYGHFILTNERHYNYEGNKLISYSKSDLIMDSLIENEKGQYVYDGENLKELIISRRDWPFDWEESEKFVFSSNNEKINYWVKSYFNDSSWKESWKNNYVYIDDQIYSITNYQMNNESSWEFYEQETFKYNEENYLTEKLEDDGYATYYDYEPGHGNAALFDRNPEDKVYCKPSYK